MPAHHTRRKSALALILIDVINHFEYPDGDAVLRQALAIAPALASLKKSARRADIPTIYVNDNFGQWRSDMPKLVAYCLRPDARGRAFVEQLQPDREDYFVLKPMHSAFYQTPLDALLAHLGASSLILTGLATNSCILCTAHDANMREYKIAVPPDCCAARSRREHNQAIEHIQAMADAEVVDSRSLRLSQFDGRAPWNRAMKNRTRLHL
jgi:nicotinamidase-related amidase